MKRAFKHLCGIAGLMLALCTISCDKEDDPQSPVQPDPQAPQEMKLAGTKWKAFLSDTLGGMVMDYDIQMELQTDSTGVMNTTVISSTYGEYTSWFNLKYTWDNISEGKLVQTNYQGTQLDELTMHYDTLSRTLVVYNETYTPEQRAKYDYFFHQIE